MAIFNSYKKQTYALCLGGGGARGYAHIGALKAFEEQGIVFDLVAGTSVGSIVAGLYAARIPASQMELFANEINLKDVHHGFMPNDPSKIGSIIKKIVGDILIEDLKLEYYAVAVDLKSAKQIILDKGPLYQAVSASCAVPIFFRPYVKDGLHLVDGGLLNNIPADVCKMMGASKVVTVDINPTRGSGTDGLGIMDVAKATLSIMTASSSVQGLIDSDIIIAPDLSAFKSTKKDGYADMIKIGYQAAMEKMDEIKQLFGIKEDKPTQEKTARQIKKEERKAKKQEQSRRRRQLKLERLRIKEESKKNNEK